VQRYDQTDSLGNWAARGVQPALQGVTVEMAHWRPTPDQHTIAELVSHIAYHRELVTRRLRGDLWEYRDEADWQSGLPTEEGWAQARSRLDLARRQLMVTLAMLKHSNLLEPLGKSWLSPELVTRRIDLAIDIATHDIYHAGQIFVLKRLFGRV
jgi:uncharacterized damage-inducible protein DinB